MSQSDGGSVYTILPSAQFVQKDVGVSYGCCPWLYLNVLEAPAGEHRRKSQQQVIPEGLESSCDTRFPSPRCRTAAF